MCAYIFTSKLCLAVFFAVVPVFNGRADPIVQYIQALPFSGPGAICQAQRLGAFLAKQKLNYGEGLPQNYSDCMADYSVNMAIIDMEISENRSYLNCMQTEIEKFRDDPEIVAMLSKDIEKSATDLRKLRQDRPARVNEARLTRQQCEKTVDLLAP